MSRITDWARWLSTLAVASLGCIQYISPPTEPTAAQQLLEAEGLYADARDLYFKVYVTDATGSGRSIRGVTLADLKGSYAALRERALERLSGLDDSKYAGDDRRAIGLMRKTLTDGVYPEGGAVRPACVAHSALGATRWGELSAQLYACYGRAQSRVITPTDTADRLTVLARLKTEGDSAKRRALFLSLRPVWESVNGDNSVESPWRRLVALSAAQWKERGSPSEVAAMSLGIAAPGVEPVLVQMLEAWERTLPNTRAEPWDWYYNTGEASRKLSAGIPLRELERMNEQFFASFGASPRSLGIVYDLVPRAGKTPVAFTQFGGLARRTRDGPRGADPSIFATYRTGGLGNLAELLHETGHAIHIAAISQRPAFADWPDSDPYTEALADVPANEVYEGRWQRKYIGDSATTAASLRQKYSGVMLDIAWALFELRMHRDPTSDPNVLWADITQQYLHIVAHPEWSWWAMRGQLIESPGYMMNYALGAMVTAAIRERIYKEKGGFLGGGPKLYQWLASVLYEQGRSKPAVDVLRAFLGESVSPRALMADVRRLPSVVR